MDLAGVECRPHYSAATSTSTSGVGFTEEQQRKESIEYNYRREAPWQLRGVAISSRTTPDGSNRYLTRIRKRRRTPYSSVILGALRRLKNRQRQMRKYELLVSTVLAVATVVAQNPPSCEPSTPMAKQKRTDMKHRKPASNGTTVEVASVSDMLAWEQPDDLQDRAVRNSDSSIDPREEEVFEVQGDLWRIAQEANDCDYHLELSLPGKSVNADRVIVELPSDPGSNSARQAVLTALEASDRLKLENNGEVLLTNPLRLKLTGYAFFDGFHYSPRFDPAHPGKCHFTKAQKLQRGNGHGTCRVGTLWELHPAWKARAVP